MNDSITVTIQTEDHGTATTTVKGDHLRALCTVAVMEAETLAESIATALYVGADAVARDLERGERLPIAAQVVGH